MLDVKRVDAVLQELWDRDARPWRKHWVPTFQKFSRDLVANAHLSRGQIVLDVGTGTGIAAREALKHVKPGGIVLAIDRSQPFLQLAQTEHAKVPNVCFLQMNSERMTFPDELFNSVISNCGISPLSSQQIIAETFRVLRRGGSLTFNDWSLIDVPTHRVFGEILRTHRTTRPSKRLLAIRSALAETERAGNRFSEPGTREEVLNHVGFREVHVKTRVYRIKLPSIRAYLAMRFNREALRQELSELSRKQRADLVRDLTAGLKQFVRNGKFVMDWKVRFIRATKPT